MNTTKNTELPEKKSRQKYAELLCDFMFKRLFGSEVNRFFRRLTSNVCLFCRK